MRCARWIGALLLLLGMVLVALTGISAGRGFQPPAGVLVASLRSEPESFNPYTARPDLPLEVLTRLMHAPLVRVNRTNGALEPWLAERIVAEEDGVSYKLHLRPNVRFSDGSPFTAEDVIASFQAVYDEASESYLSDNLRIDGQPLRVSAPDAHTVIIRFPRVYGPGLRMLDNLPILPAARLKSARGPALRRLWSLSGRAQEMAGLGPFVLVEYQPAQRLVLARNPHYWRRGADGRALPNLDRIVLEIVPDQNGELLRLQAGQIDLLATEVRPEDLPVVRREARGGRLRLWDLGPALDGDALWFNLGSASSSDKREWLRAKEFRQAISHGVDREAFVNTVYFGMGLPLHGPVSPGNVDWYAPDVPKIQYDPARARALLGSLGLRDRDADGVLEDARGEPVRFTLMTQSGNTDRERGASFIAQELRHLGVVVDVATLEPGSLFERFHGGRYDAMFFGLQSVSTDPADQLDFWLSRGHFHLWDAGQTSPKRDWEAAIDRLMLEQVGTRDLSVRKRIFADVQRLFAEHTPAIYFGVPRVIAAASTRVRMTSPGLMQPQLLWNPDELAVDLQ